MSIPKRFYPVSLLTYEEEEDRFRKSPNFQNLYNLVKIRAEKETELPPYSFLKSVFDNTAFLNLIHFLAENPGTPPPQLLLQPFPKNDDEKIKSRFRLYLRIYSREFSCVDDFSKLLNSCASSDLLYLENAKEVLKYRLGNGVVCFCYAGISYGDNSSPYDRVFDDQDANRRIKDMGLDFSAVFNLYSADVDSDFSNLIELSNLERFLRFALGPLALNIKPGGLYQEVVIVDQTVKQDL